MRERFYYWLRKVFRVPECAVAPGFFVPLLWLLFPLRMHLMTSKTFNYDARTDTVVIFGHKFGARVFGELCKYAEAGETLQFVKRENGIITVQRG